MEVSYEVKHPLGNSFQVQLGGGGFLEGFTCYLEQLFCRKPISAHSWRKELHRGCCFRIFKNKQDKNGKNKKCTIFGNLRTITQEGKKETRQMTPFFFISFLNSKLFVIFIFVFENCQNSFSWGPLFGSFWSGKYLIFGCESCKIRILSHLIQKTCT